MPVYLLHGFRWPRAGFTGIRVFIVIHDLEDAAAEYIQQQTTSQLLLEALQHAEPDIMARLPGLRFIEQYDPEDTTGENAVSQPFAYVADKVITIPDEAAADNAADLSINIEETLKRHQEQGYAAAITDLRDKLAPDGKVGWWMVYNGDPEREYPETKDEDDYDDGYDTSYMDFESEDGDDNSGVYHERMVSTTSDMSGADNTALADDASSRGTSRVSPNSQVHNSILPFLYLHIEHIQGVMLLFLTFL